MAVQQNNFICISWIVNKAIDAGVRDEVSSYSIGEEAISSDDLAITKITNSTGNELAEGIPVFESV